MTISIASGKGGTGKTTIATNLAGVLAKNGTKVKILDCDVEAPNCHLFLRPRIEREQPVELLVPEVDEKLCTLCGKCAEICEYNAIVVIGQSVLVFPELCHACGGCSIVCPSGAVTEIEHKTGVVKTGTSDSIAFIAGELSIGEAKAPPVIKEVKKYITEEAVNIVDAPPGTSCPVVESVKHTDFVILVTEPTPFGLNDLILAVEMVKKLELPFGVIINRCDIGDERVMSYCQEQQIDVLMTIPQSREIAVAYSEGRLLIDALPEYRQKLQSLYNSIRSIVSG